MTRTVHRETGLKHLCLVGGVAAWMRVAGIMSHVTTPILWGIVYFGAVTPLGFVMRVLGRRPLARPRAAPSFWMQRDGDRAVRDRMTHQF